MKLFFPLHLKYLLIFTEHIGFVCEMAKPFNFSGFTMRVIYNRNFLVLAEL